MNNSRTATLLCFEEYSYTLGPSCTDKYYGTLPPRRPFICFQIGPTLPSKLSSFTSYTRDHQFRAEADNFSCPLNTINKKTFCAPVAHYAEQFQSLITPPWTSLFDTTSPTAAAFMYYDPTLILKVSSPICSTTMTTLQAPTNYFSSGSAQGSSLCHPVECAGVGRYQKVRTAKISESPRPGLRRWRHARPATCA